MPVPWRYIYIKIKKQTAPGGVSDNDPKVFASRNLTARSAVFNCQNSTCIMSNMKKMLENQQKVNEHLKMLRPFAMMADGKEVEV